MISPSAGLTIPSFDSDTQLCYQRLVALKTHDHSTKPLGIILSMIHMGRAYEKQIFHVDINSNPPYIFNVQ